MSSGRKPGAQPSRREFVRGAGALGLSVLAPSLLRGHASSVGQLGPAGQAEKTASRASSASAEPLRASLKVEFEHRLATIDPRLYGNFIEHLGRCIYGGVFEEGSNLSDADGNRKDVLDAARKLRVTQLRWPGGNFSSGYHWRDGVGPKDSRPARFDLAWFQRESNRFGTDEFIATSRKLAAEPYLCLNLGTGTLDEASAWLEYCNREGGTYFSELRRRNGHAEPYGVKLWGLGNEVYGDWQIGHKDAADYAKAALEFAKVMKWQDPSVQLVACGNGDPAWDRPVLEALVHHVEYISAHHYTVTGDLKDYYEVLGSVAEMERLIRSSAATCESVSAKAGKSPVVATAFDEWNIINNWSDGAKRDDAHKFEIPYNLRDALWVATALNALHRNGRTVRLANLAQLVNVIAPITATPAGILLQSTYYPLELYANRAGKTVLEVAVKSPVFSTRRFGDQPYLDALCTYDDEKRRMVLAVVNRSKESDVTSNIDLTVVHSNGDGRAFVITGASPDATNTPENPHAATTRELKFSFAGNRFDYTFPRHSISWIEFGVNLNKA